MSSAEILERQNPPAGTGTVTVCLFLFRPLPRHSAQGVLMMEPLPPQRRHMLFIRKGPVLTDSCGEETKAEG